MLTALVVTAALTATIIETTAGTEPDDSVLSPFEQSLDRVPASVLDEDSAVVYYVDLERARERAGIGPDADERDRVGAMIELPTWTQPAQFFGHRFAQSTRPAPKSASRCSTSRARSRCSPHRTTS